MSTNDKPNRHDQIRAASFFPPSKCSACGANVAHWIDRAAGRAACNGCGAIIDLPALANDKPAGILSAERLTDLRAQFSDPSRMAAGVEPRVVAALLAHIDALTPPSGEVDAEALGRAHYERLHGAELRERLWPSLPEHVRAIFIDAAVALRAEGFAAGLLAPRPPGATCADCATLRERLATAERERDELRERVAELEAAPGGVAVAGLLRAIAAEIQEEDRRRVKAAVERRDRAAGEHILRRTALSFALGLAREHLAAPTPEQRAAAEVLALGQRYQPDSETSAADYLDHVETLASEGLPLDTPWEEVRNDRDRCKWAAAMALCGIVACDAKPGGGT